MAVLCFLCVIVVASHIFVVQADKECTPGATWKEDCNTCFCSETGHIGCTYRACPEHSSQTNHKVHKRNATDKECTPEALWKAKCKTCFCSGSGHIGCTSSNGDCNTCVCTGTGHIGCTLKACPPITLLSELDHSVRKRNPADKECTPGATWKEDCNTCFCSETGHIGCTYKACPQHSSQSNHKVHKRNASENSSLPQKACTPGTSWKDDCNTCFCSDTGYIGCTLIACPPISDPLKSSRRVRRRDSADKKCTPGATWKEDCNTCFCSGTGLIGCTDMACPEHASQSNHKLHKRNVSENSSLPQKACKPGTSWKDDCNTCFCTETGHIGCTLKACPPLNEPLKPSHSVRRRDSPDHMDAKGRCKPGDRWTDDCNSCVCTHTGYASCSLNDCSQVKKTGSAVNNKKRTRRDAQHMDAKGRCKPGDRWTDDCNSCVCTHTGYASCSLNDCSQVKKTGSAVINKKRTRRDAQHMDAKGRCKPGDRWTDDCNSCACTHTGYASCSLNDCSQVKKTGSAVNNKKRTRRDTQHMDAKGRCKPGDRWTDDCNSCVCTHTGYASCSLNDCSQVKKTGSAVNNKKRTRRDAQHMDAKGRCKPGDRWTDDCNSCVCTHTGYASCSLNDCSQVKKTGSAVNNKKRTRRDAQHMDAKGRCKPGDRWTDDCNSCVCTHTGYASCSLNDCSQVKKTGSAVNNKKRTRRETQHMDAKGRCKPGDRWTDDCNSCVCTHTGYASCSLNDCSQVKKTGTAVNNKKRTRRDAQHMDAKGRCKPGDRWTDDCNSCACTHTGYASCSLNDCSQVKKTGSAVNNKKRTKRDAQHMDAKGRCKPGDRWTDDCNSCACTHTGYASCSLNDCSQVKKTGTAVNNKKRTRRDTPLTEETQKRCNQPGDTWKVDCNTCECAQNGFVSCSANDCSKETNKTNDRKKDTQDMDAKGRCKPGDRWTDDCNTCVCTHTGYASCSFNDCSQVKKTGSAVSNKKRTRRDTQHMDAKGRCKPGDRWTDDCNSCVCTHTGYASCSLNDCSQVKKTGSAVNNKKRNRRDTQHMDAKGRCKPGDRWTDDCNSCVCTHTGYASCTLQLCSENSKKIRRNAEHTETDKSGTECKPGVSWQERCNSCFCSERGIAICTDMSCPD